MISHPETKLRFLSLLLRGTNSLQEKGIFHHPLVPLKVGLVRGTEKNEEFHKERDQRFFLQSGDTDWRKGFSPCGA